MCSIITGAQFDSSMFLTKSSMKRVNNIGFNTSPFFYPTGKRKLVTHPIRELNFESSILIYRIDHLKSLEGMTAISSL